MGYKMGKLGRNGYYSYCHSKFLLDFFSHTRYFRSQKQLEISKTSFKSTFVDALGSSMMSEFSIHRLLRSDSKCSSLMEGVVITLVLNNIPGV